MSAIIKANTDYKAGLITELDDSDGERWFDAISTDVISQGALLFNDFTNATPSLRGWKMVGTTGVERGPYAVCTKNKASGDIKVTGIKEGKVTVTAGGAIAPGSYLKPSITTAGAVDQFVPAGATPDNPLLICGMYVKMAKYANSGDGNNATPAAVAGDIIVMELME